MARRARQISLKECYEILKLDKGADLQAVKSAYRRRAFELHPDLNPGDPEASRQFQRLNEAYVALSAMLKPQEEARRKAEAKAQGAQGAEASGQEAKGAEQGAKAEGQAQGAASAEGARAQHAYEEQDVLRDLLNDPFARRVFEDIYSELGKKQSAEAPPPPPGPEPPQAEKKPEAPPRPKPRKEPKQVRPAPLNEKKGGVFKDGVKGWLRKQLDDEQTLTLPASGLFPGRKVRIQLRPSLSDELTAIEVTLPPDFAVGKPLRLRGLGKKVGPWQGDLYLTINSE